ncbi:hypothetical protein HMPREF9123_0249 [Neisseria bacilliformis ATCC BAA-1200]|uniref:Uncharacterized protein n=1 Tax=Neisseria bacilliformis ATCC BAA-1200 TaxID=888742 RepID=F2B975_9NEIS|nr:hypothetical protein HMPREF9123_0249 [Neisseria bacilliformis ATCC BAA-1200]
MQRKLRFQTAFGRQGARASPQGDTPYVRFSMGWYFQTASAIG